MIIQKWEVAVTRFYRRYKQRQQTLALVHVEERKLVWIVILGRLATAGGLQSLVLSLVLSVYLPGLLPLIVLPVNSPSPPWKCPSFHPFRLLLSRLGPSLHALLNGIFSGTPGHVSRKTFLLLFYAFFLSICYTGIGRNNGRKEAARICFVSFCISLLLLLFARQKKWSSFAGPSVPLTTAAQR